MTESLTFTVQRKHNLKAVQCDPYHCALMQAISDVPGVSHIRVDRKRVVLQRDGQWMRGATPSEMQVALCGFDKGRQIRPGTTFSLALDPIDPPKRAPRGTKSSTPREEPAFMIRRIDGVSRRVPLQD